MWPRNVAEPCCLDKLLKHLKLGVT
jgi:hypothetical protein